jgi:hypothetical protein
MFGPNAARISRAWNRHIPMLRSCWEVEQSEKRTSDTSRHHQWTVCDHDVEIVLIASNCRVNQTCLLSSAKHHIRRAPVRQCHIESIPSAVTENIDYRMPSTCVSHVLPLLWTFRWHLHASLQIPRDGSESRHMSTDGKASGDG